MQKGNWLNSYSNQKDKMCIRDRNNALLLDRLKARTLEFQTAELETRRMREENDELLDSVDKDLVRLRKQVEELTRTNEALKYENQGLRSKLNRTDAAPILYLGGETELFPDEIKAILLDALEAELPKYEEKTRRHTVIEDVIRENDCKKTAGEKAEKLKNLLKGYKSLSGSLKQELQNMGFEITDDGKHSKLTYYGDSRYMATLAKTPVSYTHLHCTGFQTLLFDKKMHGQYLFIKEKGLKSSAMALMKLPGKEIM